MTTYEHDHDTDPPTPFGEQPQTHTTDLGSETATTTEDDSSTTGAADRAKSATSTTADQGKHLAGSAKEEVQNVAGTAAQQARGVMDQTLHQVTGQMTDQASTQRDKLSETLRTLGDDLEKMASQGPGSGLAADLTRELSERARALGLHLQDREPGQLLDDARAFARRRPGTFLLGALAAGVVAGRLFRATADGAASASAEASAEATEPAGPAVSPSPPTVNDPYAVAEPNATGPQVQSSLGMP